MKILIYGNRKQDSMVWDISTPEKRKEGFLALFQYLRDVWDVYSCGDLSKTQEELKKRTEAGDAQAAEYLLEKRKGREYEEWIILETQN